jgi:hypothetical protein
MSIDTIRQIHYDFSAVLELVAHMTCTEIIARWHQVELKPLKTKRPELAFRP